MGSTDPLSGIDMLRHVARIAVEYGGQPGARFADGVQQFIAGRDQRISLEAVFGITPMQSFRSWGYHETLRDRDRLVRRAVQEFYSSLRPTPASAALSSAMHRYFADGWPRDHASGARPCNRLDGALFDILALKPLPLSPRAIKAILDHQR